jgi:hypothetical protein
LFFEGGTTLNFTDADDKEYNLTATNMKVSPIFHKEVLTTAGGKKVAYLLYDQFNLGAKQGNKYEFDEELRSTFGEFKTAGATELVLDLRYNPGGHVASCQSLSSLIGDVTTSQVFMKLKYNASFTQGNPEVLFFLNEPNSLKLKTVYVLTTGSSASASESVINSLRGVDVNVVIIGADTIGKNMGMDLMETTIGKYRYEMRPITFKTLNAKNSCDFAGGFTPTIYKNELWDVLYKGGSGEILELGDPLERLLATALSAIDGNNPAPDARPGSTRAATTGLQQMPLPENPRRGGLINIPSHFDREAK